MKTTTRTTFVLLMCKLCRGTGLYNMTRKKCEKCGGAGGECKIMEGHIV